MHKNTDADTHICAIRKLNGNSGVTSRREYDVLCVWKQIYLVAFGMDKDKISSKM